MKRFAWILAALVSLGVAVYASIFPIAEIFTEVVVLRTYDSEGSPHETRLTVIDRGATAWVRGRPYRGWFTRIEANPGAELYRDGVWRPVEGLVSRDPSDAAAFDQVMFDTYGFAYRYVDFIARISASEVPVRLVPLSP
jgi:hypothetical protein